MTIATKTKVTCPKCLGSKYFGHFKHIESGVCFTCSGAGIVDFTEIKEAAQTAQKNDTKQVSLKGFGTFTVTAMTHRNDIQFYSPEGLFHIELQAAKEGRIVFVKGMISNSYKDLQTRNELKKSLKEAWEAKNKK
jgi:hypothetical protein